jgi:hypothetical protein
VASLVAGLRPSRREGRTLYGEQIRTLLHVSGIRGNTQKRNTKKVFLNDCRDFRAVEVLPFQFRHHPPGCSVHVFLLLLTRDPCPDRSAREKKFQLAFWILRPSSCSLRFLALHPGKMASVSTAKSARKGVFSRMRMAPSVLLADIGVSWSKNPSAWLLELTDVNPSAGHETSKNR